MTSYRVTDLVTGLPATVPFVGPEAQERAQGRVFDARIGANENMFGPSPTVIDAIIEMAGESWMYGDPELHDLRHAIARTKEKTGGYKKKSRPPREKGLERGVGG